MSLAATPTHSIVPGLNGIWGNRVRHGAFERTLRFDRIFFPRQIVFF